MDRSMVSCCVEVVKLAISPRNRMSCNVEGSCCVQEISLSHSALGVDYQCVAALRALVAYEIAGSVSNSPGSQHATSGCARYSHFR